MEILKASAVTKTACVPRSSDRTNLKMPVARVLLADGHDAIRRGVRSLLESGNRNCTIVAEARDGREALQLAIQSKPDIAIIGYALRGMNGVDLTYAMRHAGLTTNVLLYTMHDTPEVITNALEAGIRAYVLKSDPEDSLLAAVEALSKGQAHLSQTVSDTLLARFVEAERSSLQGGLTPREREIVQLISEGSLNKVIAHKLGVTIKTIETHRGSAMRKLKLRSTAQLVRWAIRNDLVLA
jgi:DNA-binding NarL/FixJ family response regulator